MSKHRPGKRPGGKRERPGFGSTRPDDRQKRQGGGERQASPFAQRSFLAEGVAAVAEYLRFRPSAVTELLCAPRARNDAMGLLQRHGVQVPIKEHPADVDAESAAPVAARVTLKALESDVFFSRIKQRSRDLILALDHVQDPRNLGAIVRTAAFFGVSEVLAPERRQVLLTQASVATAQGGFALTDLVCVVNLGRTLSELKERGYWIVGADMEGESLAKVAGEYEKVVLVLGSEESGMSKSVRNLCDRVAAIPSLGAGLESLNVSVAAGIFLHAFASARGTPER